MTKKAMAKKLQKIFYETKTGEDVFEKLASFMLSYTKKKMFEAYIKGYINY